MKICPTCKSQYEGGEVFCPVDAARLVTHSQLSAPDSPESDPLVGTTLDRYKIIRRIGEGGMGFVYEALHTVIEKRVAIKTLRKDFSSRSDVVERFRQEAKSASRIGHEHIVDISDFGETPDGNSYFVMEYLEGRDLADLLAHSGVLTAQHAIDILVQCCRALGAAHAKGIVHRDMKPENIFLIRRENNPDFVKIVDFGIAKMNEIETPGEAGRKLTKTGMIFGTPEYMSPEQAAGKPVDHRVDIYAMGVIFFELITGRVPYVGDSFMGILTQHMFEPVPPFTDVNPNAIVPLEVEAVILKALAKKPEDRYQSMEQLADALIAAGQGRSTDQTLVGYARPIAAPRTEGRGFTALRVDEPDVARGRATTISAAPSQPRTGLWVGLGAALAIAAGGGIYFAMKGAGDSVTDAAGVDAAGVAAAADAGNAVGVAALEVDAGYDAGPTMVALMVETRPTGGEITVEGSETRCAPAPCTIEVLAGQAVKLRAENGRSVGELEITPTQAMAIIIPLAARPSSHDSNASTGTPRPPAMMDGDLRVPDIFR